MTTRTLIIAATVTIFSAAPVAAQDHPAAVPTDGHGYLTGGGGFTTSLGNTAGNIQIEGGIRVAPHLQVYGNFGGFSNLQAELAPAVNADVAGLAANQGLSVVGAARLPAAYFTTGARFDIPVHGRVLPYVLGGIGVAHLMPEPQFTFSSGTMPDGSTPAVGDDVTSALTTSGEIVVPASSSEFMYTVGAGVEVTVFSSWFADTAYRYSRIAADPSLTASPLTINGMTFGFGYRF